MFVKLAHITLVISAKRIRLKCVLTGIIILILCRIEMK